MLAIGYLIVAGSWIGFTAYVWLLHNVSTAKVATYAYVNPIVAVFLGWLILHERITAYIAAGSVIVMVSVILITGAKHTPTLHRAGTGAGCRPDRYRNRLRLSAGSSQTGSLKLETLKLHPAVVR